MLALTLTAELTGVTDLRPLDTADHPFYYMFRIQCTSCREVHRNRVGISQFDAQPLSNSRGDAHFVWRCRNCHREASATVKSGPQPYKISSPPTRQIVITLECRGCEFLDFRPDGEWLLTGEETGTPFEGVDFGTDSEWFDYDEKAAAEVSVKDMVWEVRRA